MLWLVGVVCVCVVVGLCGVCTCCQLALPEHPVRHPERDEYHVYEVWAQPVKQVHQCECYHRSDALHMYSFSSIS